MPKTYVTDMTDHMDDSGELAAELPPAVRRIASFNTLLIDRRQKRFRQMTMIRASVARRIRVPDRFASHCFPESKTSGGSARYVDCVASSVIGKTRSGIGAVRIGADRRQ